MLRTRAIDSLACESPLAAKFFTVAVLASLIPASRLIRRGDVRFKTDAELKQFKTGLNDCIKKQLRSMAHDLTLLQPLPQTPKLVCDDARQLQHLLPLDAGQRVDVGSSNQSGHQASPEGPPPCGVPRRSLTARGCSSPRRPRGQFFPSGSGDLGCDLPPPGSRHADSIRARVVADCVDCLDGGHGNRRRYRHNHGHRHGFGYRLPITVWSSSAKSRLELRIIAPCPPFFGL